uniref:Uncharacterized protein LOC111106867 n=1 Tax=Crassostrea virginica TaxID=6565 RepID=A0A8B8B1Z7_CRAVI|nr:uncharacterized protein LOC111106867 [Crassostrea virginica]XP_022297436.1 uncharacterized protein LOC111106867 [Crassostrea virginica]XP_022297437.1 uncharacterized protein LOC111106867 [Crassostrea virginica]
MKKMLFGDTWATYWMKFMSKCHFLYDHYERIKSSPEKEVSDEILTEERAGLEKDGSKPLMEKAASLKKSDELHGFLDTREEDREESDIFLAMSLREVLHISCSLTEEVNRISERILTLDLDLLNNDPTLKENGIHIVSICSLPDQISDD